MQPRPELCGLQSGRLGWEGSKETRVLCGQCGLLILGAFEYRRVRGTGRAGTGTGGGRTPPPSLACVMLTLYRFMGMRVGVWLVLMMRAFGLKRSLGR